MPTRYVSLLALLSLPLGLSAATLNFVGGEFGTTRTWAGGSSWDTGIAPATGDDLIIGSVPLNGNQTTLYSGSTYMALSGVSSPYTVTLRSLTFTNALGQFPANGVELRNSSAGTAAAGTIVFNTAGIDALRVEGGSAPVVTIRSRAQATPMTINLDYTGQANFHVSTGGRLALDTTSTATATGLLTGTGGINKTGAGTLALTGGAVGNTFAGGLTIGEGVVTTDSNLRLGPSNLNKADAVVINGGTLRYTNESAITNVAGRGFQVGSSVGTIDLPTGALRMDSVIGNVTGQAGVLRLTGSQILGLGAGTTHTGGTLLEGGQITLIDGVTLGGVGGAGLSAAANTTLRGSGTIHGDSTFASNSTLRVDQMSGSSIVSNEISTLTFADNLTLAGVNLLFDLGAPGTSDQILVNGVLTIGSGSFDLSNFTFTAQPTFAPGVYTLFSSNNPVFGTLGSSLSGTVGGFDAQLGLSSGGNSLLLTVIPEPATYALVFGAAALLGVALRRRSRAS
jgi:autotransporter-associated beta strand protein